jgi:MFS family permease
MDVADVAPPRIRSIEVFIPVTSAADMAAPSVARPDRTRAACYGAGRHRSCRTWHNGGLRPGRGRRGTRRRTLPAILAAGVPPGRGRTQTDLNDVSEQLPPARADGPTRPRLALAADDLLRDPTYRRLWGSTLISSFGNQVSLLALPLTAAVLLNASASQMGLLTAMEIVPFVLFSLPSGVWLDRVRKLPVYVFGELLTAAAVTVVPLAWWMHELSMPLLYLVAFVLGAVNTTAGSASQIVLTQLVPRERLVEGHAKNALASSMAEVMGPGVAGLLIRLTGAPLALLANAALLVGSATILKGIRLPPDELHPPTRFWPAMRVGLDFVLHRRLLVTMAAAVGTWQFCYQGTMAVQILFATRILGLSERAVGLSYVALGAGTILSSAIGHRVVARIGPGPALILGFALCGLGWTLLALSPGGAVGIVAFVAMLFLYGIGAVFIFINFLALRQSVTPAPMLGRMTSTMRWLILLPAGPGALFGGWIGEQLGVRASLLFSGAAALALAALVWTGTAIRRLHALPGLNPEAPRGTQHSVRPG